LPAKIATAPHGAERIALRATAALIPYARNPRTHSDDQVAQIAASIREFGFTNPVLVDGAGGIIAGHGRVLAAQQLGLAEVPTIALGYLTPIQRRAYVIADNQLALNAGWNLELLRLEMQALDTDHFDLSLTGFGEDQLADLLAGRDLPEFTGEFEWYTPAEIIEPARSVLGGIDLDPASSETAQRTIRAKRYYTREDDGLSRKWRGRVWLNPPYAANLVGKFVAKLCEHVAAGDVKAAIMLVDDRTDTRWFHAAAVAAERICFPAGRIHFVRPAGDPGGPLNGSALFYFGGAPDAFEDVFGKIGLVLCRTTKP
jgi:phage N-6-adenine-methyltransferase